jgi:hypothetical protein
LLTTEVMVAEAPKDEEHAHGGGGGGWGGGGGRDGYVRRTDARSAFRRLS